jgi:hypothetical protein
MTIRSFPIASLLLLAVCGCSGSSSSSTANSGGTGAGGTGSGGTSSGPGTPVAAAALGSTLANAYCPSIAACCASAGIAQDPSSCTTTLRTQLDAQISLQLGNPKIAYDAAAAGRCVEAYRAAASACTDRALSDQVHRLCQVFSGTVPPGGACATSKECTSPATGYASCDTAVCVVHPDDFNSNSVHAKAGEPCSSTCSGDAHSSACSGTASTSSTASASCWLEDGLYCAADNTCQATPKIGQPCADLNYCEAAGHCESGTCVADTATGACTSTDGCIATAYCDSSSSPAHCAPRKANLEACNNDEECLGGQCEQDHCRNWSVATPASCAGIFD